MWRETKKGSPDVLWVNESSPDLAETSFRELDDVFLQTQTRIWLGEVLHVRFDEDVKIADLLADGELLFQVSKEVWKMLLRRHGELKHSKVHIYERTSSGKGDGRYMPYPKVDSFLKICQILGLTGIDLFSPSDVVEKRDIRRVCMCIRSLSKKARSKKLNVPDFDIVTYTIAMPTHLVGGIRRSLELSRFSPSSFSATSPWNDAREICGLRIPFGQHSLHSDSRSDESESNFGDLQFESPSSSASCDATNIAYIVGETSPELSPVVDDFVHETSFNNSIEDSNNYEFVDEHQEEMFCESICSCHLSKMETSTLRNSSSSSCSGLPSDQDTSICLSDIGKGSDDSIPKEVNNGLKAEDLAGTVDVETSYQAYMNASSINVAPSEDNQHSQSSSPSIFSKLEVHSNLGVEPYNTRQKSSVFENAIAANNKAMKNRFYHMETSDDSNSVAPKSYSVDPEADGNDRNLPGEIKSPLILYLNSLDNYACDSEFEGSYSFFSSFELKQNKFSGSLVGHERNQNGLAHTSSSSVENDCALLLRQSDDPNYQAKRKCGSQSTNPLISSFTESEFECSSSSSMCLTCNDVNIEDGSMQENDVYKANFMTDLNEASINALVAVVQEDVDIAAHSLSFEKGKFCNDASYRSSEVQFMSSSLNSGTEAGSKIENAEQVDVSYHSCQTQESLRVVVKGNLSEEPCIGYNSHKPDSASENKMRKYSSELIENNGSSSNYAQGKDYGCICDSMVEGSSSSGLPCMVSTISEQLKSPEKEDSIGYKNGYFYNGISSVDDSDCSDELKVHQASYDAPDIAFPLCNCESKIPPTTKGHAADVADEESLVNPESCEYDDGKMRDFGHQMIMNSFYTKDLEVLDVMESSDFTYSDCASEMIPSFDFCRYGLFPSDRNILKTEGETFLTVDILPGSTSDCREGGEVTSDGSIIVEKQVVSYIQAACPEPNNAPQAILDNTIFQNDTVLPDECDKWKDREGRIVGKTANQVLKSVAGVMTMIGAFVLFLHVRQKKDREKKNETGMPFQIHKPNQEFFTERRIKIGKSDSLYPGEKLKF